MEQPRYFGAIDYVIFTLTLLLSSVIGIYFAYKQRKRLSSNEYLLANKSIPWFPLFVSMLASYFSAVGLMGLPAVIYSTGITFSFNIIGTFINIMLSAELFTPIFRRLDLVSANQYLERRFSASLRIWGCVLYHIQYLTYMSVALYAPSLALGSVAGVPTYVTIVSTGIVCTFYTSLGGMKAVVWTDVFQGAIMLVGLLTISIVGANEVGSLKRVFDIAKERERLTIDYDLDPRAYHTVWGVIIGGSISRMSVWAVGQTTVQRAVAAKSLKDAKLAMYSSACGSIVISLLLAINTLIVFAVYGDCDLVKSKRITRNDQIMPYFVVNKLGHIKGMPGLFTACLFSFALSTLSSGLNSVSALFLKDIIMKVKPDLSDQTATTITKWAAAVYGLCITGLAFLVPVLGKFVITITIKLFGIAGGPYMSMFVLGMFTRTCNKYGAFWGSIAGIAVGLFLNIGQILYPAARNLLSISVKGCPGFNSSESSGIIYPKDPMYNSSFPQMFSISYIWFGMISFAVSFLVGYVISLCTKSKVHQRKLDDALLYSYKNNWFIRRCFRRKQRKSCQLNDGSNSRVSLMESKT